eukprot:jgi/Galph1/2561/GphlegSOOS_G1209.1
MEQVREINELEAEHEKNDNSLEYSFDSDKDKLMALPNVTDEDLFKKEPLTPTLKLLLFFVAFGSIMMGMDQSLLTTAAIFAQPNLGLSSSQWSWVTSAFSLATAFGCFFAIPMGEYLGRKRTLQISAAVCFVGGVMQTAAKDFRVILAGRLLLGLGMGQEAMNIPIYVAECAPAHGRGGHLTLFNWFQQAGAPTAYVINAIFLQVNTSWRWRLMLGPQCVAAFVQFMGLLPLPESPRWLLMKGKEDAAKNTWSRLRHQTPVAKYEYKKMRLGIEEDLKNRRTYWDSIKLIFISRRVRTPFYIGAILGMSSQFSGITAIGYYLTSLLEVLGLTTATAVYAEIPIGFWTSMIASIPFFLLDRYGRRPVLMYTFPPQILSIIISLSSFYIPLSKQSERAECYFIGYLLYLAFNNIGISAIQWVMAGELYETEVRSIGAAWSAFWIFASAFVNTYTFSKQVDAVGVKGLYGLYTGFTVFFTIVLFFVYPETKGKTLEEVKDVMDRGIVYITKKNVLDAWENVKSLGKIFHSASNKPTEEELRESRNWLQ